MACERELVDAFGGSWTEEDARSIIGFDLLAAAAELRDRGGVDLDPADIVERMLDGVIARVRVKVPWRPGARRLLSELNDLGVPCALVTMSWSRLVDAVVDELAPINFQAIVTGDHVDNGKPHAEPYLLAADRLGVDPTECVAIEDSPTGIESAHAAGCVVVAVPNLVPIEPAPGRVVVPTLKEVSPPGSWPLPRQASPDGCAAAPHHGAPDTPRRPPSGGHRRCRGGRRAGCRRRRRRHLDGRWCRPITTTAAAAAANARCPRCPRVDPVLGDRRCPPRAPGASGCTPRTVAVLVAHHGRVLDRDDAQRPPGSCRRLPRRRP